MLRTGTKRTRNFSVVAMLTVGCVFATSSASFALSPSTPVSSEVDVLELGVAGLKAALEAGDITSADAVTEYLDRIAAFDSDTGEQVGLNSIINLNPNAAAQAAEMDAERAAGSIRGPLHGVPILIKDNTNTSEMPTTHGNEALAAYQPLEDAGVVKKLKDAGAIILGKTNMAEFALFWDTQSSIAGRTHNPYGLDKNINGSSGGSAAAVASSFAAAATGTESCGSITDPAAFSNLVGVRPTPGLVSRDGMDYSPLGDSAGPLTLSVEDAALMLDAMVGTDAADPLTASADTIKPESYTAALSDTALEGKKIGYMLAPISGNTYTTNEFTPSVIATADAAMDEMEEQGATVVPITITSEFRSTYYPSPMSANKGQEQYFVRTEADVPEGLAALTAPFDAINYADLIAASPNMDSYTANALNKLNNVAYDEITMPKALANRAKFSEGIEKLMDDNGLDALAFVTVANTPVTLHDDGDTRVSVDSEQSGTHCAWANRGGHPVISVPAGFDGANMPVGVSILGHVNDDATMLAMAYDYEQATQNRVAPATTPSILETIPPVSAVDNTKVPTISGTVRVGSTLKATKGSWTPSSVSVKYAWLRNGVKIGGANSSSYTLKAQDRGTRTTVRVTATAPGLTSTAALSSTTAIVKSGVLKVATPKVSGTATVGKKLTAVSGSWTSGTTFSYRWLRDGTKIGGATTSTYTLKAKDKSARITVTVTGTKPGYLSAVATSARTARVSK